MLTIRLSRLLLLVPALAVVAHALWLYNHPFEDAFISFRYARNLAAGLGFVYNPGQVVEGFTSLSWVVLLAAVAWAEVRVPKTAVVLSLGCGALLAVATGMLARRWAPGALWRPLAAGLIVACHGTVAYCAASGMETTLFALLINGAVLTAMSSNRRAAIGTGVLLALSVTTRPEGLGYAALILAALAIGKESRGSARRAALVFALLVAPFMAWKWVYFGHPFPNTFYAKAAATPQTLWRGL